MSDRQVSYAIHGGFFKQFFPKHNKILRGFSELTFSDVKKGYSNLLIFYSTNSYYLKDEQDIKQLIISNSEDFENNEIYSNYYKKTNGGINLTKLNISDLIKFNDIYINELLNIFGIFEGFCEKLAPSDIMPSLTDNHSDYEKSILFASYELFYENLFSFHARIGELFEQFNIITFTSIYRVLMAFYYGYSYYLSKSTKNKIKDLFVNIWQEYNNNESLTLYIKYLKENLTKTNLNELKRLQKDLFLKMITIFELINLDLPKQNLMPKKKNIILFDETTM